MAAAVPVVEDGAADRRRPGRDQLGKHAPPGQLEDAGAHQRVGGDGVRAGPRAFEHHDSKAGPGQQQGGRGAGDPAADDDDVVVVHEGSSPVQCAVRVGPRSARSGRQVVHDGVRVMAGAVDEAGVPAVLEALTDHVDPRRVGHARGSGGRCRQRRVIGRSTQSLSGR